jgi:hypothetical protein
MLQALQASPGLLGPQLGLACLGTSSLLRRTMQSWATVDPDKWNGSHPAVVNNLGECVEVLQELWGVLLARNTCIHSSKAAATAVIRPSGFRCSLHYPSGPGSLWAGAQQMLQGLHGSKTQHVLLQTPDS